MAGLQKSKTFYKWLLSYIIISGVVVAILGLFVFSKTSSVIDQQTVEIYRSMIDKESMFFDSRLNRNKELGVKFSSLPWAEKAMSANRDLGEVFDYFKLTEISREISYCKNVDNLIFSIALIFPCSNNIIDVNGRDTIDNYFSNIISFKSSETERMYDDIEKYNYFQINDPTEVDVYQNRYCVIPVIQSLQYNIGIPRGTLLILLDQNSLLKTLEKRREGKYRSFIMYNNGTILADKGMTDGINPKLMGKIYESKNEIDSFSCENDFTYIVQSSFAQWKYVYIFPKDMMMANGRMNAIFIIISAVMALLIGFLLSLYFSFKNYNPVMKLLKSIGELLMEPAITKKKESEFQVIETAVSQLSKEKNKFEVKLGKYKQVIQSNILMRLIKGDFSNEAEGNKLIEETELYDSKEMHFCVIVLECSEMPEKTSNKKSSNRKYIEAISIIELVEKIVLTNGLKGQAFQTDNNRTAAILCLNSIPEKETVNLNFIVSTLKAGVKDALDIDVVIGKGNITSKCTGISKSYQMAVEMLDWIIFTGNDSEINIAKFSETNSSHYFYPIQWEERLANNLKKGDLAAVENIVKEIKYENLVKRTLCFNVFKRLLLEIFETEMRVIDELSFSDIIREGEYERVITSRRESELWIYIEKVYCEICSHISSKRECSDSEFANKLVQFVDNNCSSPDLSQKDIADKFNLSVSYVSIIFKEITGCNFSDYVFDKRMEKARHLLETTDEEIQVIAGKVGYLSDKTFRRAFKKHEGVSPIEYKKIARQAG